MNTRSNETLFVSDEGTPGATSDEYFMCHENSSSTSAGHWSGSIASEVRVPGSSPFGLGSKGWLGSMSLISGFIVDIADSLIWLGKSDVASDFKGVYGGAGCKKSNTRA